MVSQDEVIQLINIKGPIVPVQISKEIKQNILMTSAILSQLTSTKKLKISHLKIGGSPLYYLPGQEKRLQSFVKHLDEKDQRTVTLLREKNILQDEKQEPLIRVSLRNIKDFAVPLTVNAGETKQLFWKWYLLSNEEAEPIIKRSLGMIEKKEDAQQVPQVKQKTASEGKDEKIEQKQLKQEETNQNVDRREESTQKQEVNQEQNKVPEKQNRIHDEKKEISVKNQKENPDDDFLNKIRNYFEENNVIVKSTKKIKKTEFEFEIKIETALGKLPYYCKAKDKKRISDGDLSETFVKGQYKKLPAIFLTGGELTKKAKSMLESELKGLTFTQLKWD